ncbi:hypothetical protein QBC34DRAFT_422079 [Podospora aff. communis PSN243]|uniref:Stress-response A/B barrel domain-containing protein n=1 Tax=Podospora aff. communis PSN243 TaxID=3040156 RepID=A0AAV9H004_9PEZI|nr:hypothetical protein QBC34DRAFT_422079 [Podospora aff. communis PSN243]
MSTTPPMSSGQIRRITMFKIPEGENQQKLVDAYGVLAKEQQKGGQPYILSTQAAVVSDPRSKGYTVVAEMQFASLDDMNYYDNECKAHTNLKKGAMGLGVTEPPLVVYY